MSFTALVAPAYELELATSVHAEPSDVVSTTARLFDRLAALSIEQAQR